MITIEHFPMKEKLFRDVRVGPNLGKILLRFGNYYLVYWWHKI